MWYNERQQSLSCGPFVVVPNDTHAARFKARFNGHKALTNTNSKRRQKTVTRQKSLKTRTHISERSQCSATPSGCGVDCRRTAEGTLISD